MAYTLNPVQEIVATRLASDERSSVKTQSNNTCNCLAHNWTCRWNVSYLTEGAIILERQVLDDIPPPNSMYASLSRKPAANPSDSVPRSPAQPLTQAQWDSLTYKIVDPSTVVLWKLFEPPMFRGESITLERTRRWLSHEPWVEILRHAPPGETIQRDHIFIRCIGCNRYRQIDSPTPWMRHRDECTGIEKRVVFFMMERWERRLL